MESINAGGNREKHGNKAKAWMSRCSRRQLGRQRAATAQSRSDVLETVWNQAVFHSTLVPYCMNLSKLLHLGLSDTREKS